jgi:aspartate/methionine/tyrosine aminotransferase
MADSVISTKLKDHATSWAYAFVNESDGTGESNVRKVNANTLIASTGDGASQRLTVNKIAWTIAGANSKVKLMWVNYPHMPTGARASQGLFEKIIQFGKRHDILIIHDNPYSFILEDKPSSILSINGAKEIAMELNSLSKTANMAGWRVGALVGKAEFIDGVLKVKSNMDSGMFLGIQSGAIAALSLGQDWYALLNETYLNRRNLVWELAELLDLEIEKDAVGMFVWAKIKSDQSDFAFVDELLDQHHLFITPGSIFGSQGKGHVRFSLCISEEKIIEAINRIK